jgi:hypothetical protein
MRTIIKLKCYHPLYNSISTSDSTCNYYSLSWKSGSYGIRVGVIDYVTCKDANSIDL